MHAVRRRSPVSPQLRSSGRGLSRRSCNAAKAEARLGAVEFGSRGGGACGASARGMARITSSKIHARSGGGNRGVADVLVVQHQSTYKVEAFRNRNGDRAAGTIRGRTSNGRRTHINVANAPKVRRGCRVAEIGISVS